FYCSTFTVVFFFFFQAEDGIRDLTVTGVQTCALPISIDSACPARAADPIQSAVHRRGRLRRPPASESGPIPRRRVRSRAAAGERSEERRVGKECRCGWGRDD